MSQRQPLSKLGSGANGPVGNVINPTPEYLVHLERLRNQMRGKSGIRIELLSDNELINRIKCENCGLRCTKRLKTPKQQPRKGDKNGTSGQSQADPNDKIRSPIAGVANGEPKPKKPIMKCRFHPGKLERSMWTCCNQYGSKPGCQESEEHVPERTTLAELAARFQYVPTYDARRKAAAPHRRVAVAIDCEMGTSKDMEPEVIRLTLIDYFTSEVLIDSLVWPDVPILHYNTRYSGITRKQMYDARRARQCIMGVDKARELAWRYVDSETFVIGHSLQSDLSSMRWLHHVVVDSFVIENDIWNAAVRRVQMDNRVLINAFEALKLEDEINGRIIDRGEKPKGEPLPKAILSLKDVTMTRLGKRIQEGRLGHDSLEDALAARDLVDWHVRKSMESTEDLIVL